MNRSGRRDCWISRLIALIPLGKIGAGAERGAAARKFNATADFDVLSRAPCRLCDKHHAIDMLEEACRRAGLTEPLPAVDMADYTDEELTTVRSIMKAVIAWREAKAK